MTALMMAFQALFGIYEPVTYEHTYEYVINGQVQTVVLTRIMDGLAGLDWAYIGGVVLFVICLVSFFKCAGGLVKRAGC